MRLTVVTSPSASTTSSRSRPTPRMPALGGLITGVKTSTPNAPRALTLKVPPSSSPGASAPRAGGVGEPARLGGEIDEVPMGGVAYHRHQQPVVDRDRQPDMDLGQDGDPGLGDLCVHARVHGERPRGRRRPRSR